MVVSFIAQMKALGSLEKITTLNEVPEEVLEEPEYIIVPNEESDEEEEQQEEAEARRNRVLPRPRVIEEGEAYAYQILAESLGLLDEEEPEEEIEITDDLVEIMLRSGAEYGKNHPVIEPIVPGEESSDEEEESND